jgi:5-methylcytosine-specific restriction endonuclease McrA
MVKDFYSQFLGTPKKVKAPKIKLHRIYATRAGDRTLTSAQKRKIKEDQGFRCARCGKKTDARYLEVHHKKGVAKHKNPIGDLPVYSWGKKIKPKSDRRSNLEAVCLKCHDKTKKKKKKANNLLGINTRGLFG